MIVIPMAGLSSRFFRAGYTLPKYQLPLGNETVFTWAVRSFARYFTADCFVFIYRDIYDTKAFIEAEVLRLGIQDYRLVALSEETLGQADTVYRGIQGLADEPLFIFNIDSKLENFEKPSWYLECDGYLEVFKGEGDHWSFAVPGESNRVIRTTEKERVSELCSNGLYYFRSSQQFNELVESAIQDQDLVNNELYIAPLYNRMIANGTDIRYQLVGLDQINFCGVPAEYEAMCASVSEKQPSGEIS
ncbi:glycosyltransferase family 2 protein [Ignatzschineria larvae DSM 13226]|uniref:Glycosyltransferase family 2 protein n=1 Tax=Ignatzschineria larvae DSM 13226 TaxID=1111732 RepID=A0ABZ3BX99_9GAMM|nr:glycosyltransferase family 2 protein [Ignatzschineria larvae]